MSTDMFQDYKPGDLIEVTLRLKVQQIHREGAYVITTGVDEYSFPLQDDDVDSVELVKPAPIPHEEREIGSLWLDPVTDSKYVRVDPGQGDWKYVRFHRGSPVDHLGPVLYPTAQEDKINRLVPA